MRIVVLRALGLGDFLTAVPAYRAIRRAFPASHITLAAPRALEALVDLLDGAIDTLADVREAAPLPATLGGADLGINLHGCGPQSHRILLAAQPRRLIAFRHAAVEESAGGAAFEPREHEVARWCRLLREAGIAADPGELDLTVPPIAVPEHLREATVIHPGAASEARRWPADRWAAVARAELRRGRRVVITGSADERERALAIGSSAGVAAAQVLAGRTDLLQVAAVIASAARIVCSDTGVAHLATAFRRPSVVLFGPTAPVTWGPPPRPYHRVLWAGTTGDPHANRIDPGLAAISVQRVIAALNELPSNAKTA